MWTEFLKTIICELETLLEVVEGVWKWNKLLTLDDLDGNY